MSAAPQAERPPRGGADPLSVVGGMIRAMTTPAAVIVDATAYAQAVEDAAHAAAAYYAGGSSPLDDDAYDRLARGIAAWEAEHPDEVLPDSPTGKVAGGAAEGDVPHTVPMLSLDNVFSPEEFTVWTASLARRIDREVTRFSVGPKLDGLAVAARYREGRLTRLITRGDGTAGEDVSHAIGTVEGLPGTLAEPVTVEVRGEILMTTAQFEHANEVRIRHGGQPFANPRNAAAGTLRAKERAYTVPMTFFGYGLLALPGTDAALAGRLEELPYSELMETAAGLGVHTSAGTAVPDVVVGTPEQVVARVQEIAALRAELPFGIDGIVVKADLAADRRAAGSGSRAPRWAIAYKLPAVEKITRLLEVEWNVGRTGIIAPRGVLEPVVIEGSTITYATLHNPADITRRGLRLGDHVMVHRAGDVIPRIEAPVAHLRTGEEQPIVFPEACPRCGSDIDTSEERWRCAQGRNCHLVASSPTPRGGTSSTSRGWAPPGSSSSSRPGSWPTWPTCSCSGASSCSPWSGWARPAPTTCSPRWPGPRSSRCPGCCARWASGAPAGPCPGASPGTSPPWTTYAPPTPRPCSGSTASGWRRPPPSSRRSPNSPRSSTGSPPPVST